MVPLVQGECGGGIDGHLSPWGFGHKQTEGAVGRDPEEIAVRGSVGALVEDHVAIVGSGRRIGRMVDPGFDGEIGGPEGQRRVVAGVDERGSVELQRLAGHGGAQNHRRVVDGGDGDADRLGGGSAVAVVNGHGKAIGAGIVGVWRISEGAVGVHRDRAVGGLRVQAVGQRIVVDVGGGDAAGNRRVLARLDGGRENSRRRGHILGIAGDGAVMGACGIQRCRRRAAGLVVELQVGDQSRLGRGHKNGHVVGDLLRRPYVVP